MKYATATYHSTQHLVEAELLPELQACPWCGSEQRLVLTCLQKQPEVMLYDCGACHAVRASRMPGPEALAKYYSAYYSSAEYQKSGCKVTFGNPERMGRHLAALTAKAAMPKHVKVVDYGGGDGTVAVQAAVEMLKQQGVEQVCITVVDYSTDLVSSPDARIMLKLASSMDDLVVAGYDFVIASAVIEHITDGPQILPRVLALVRHGGLLYLRTPQIKAFLCLAKRLGLAWDFTFPAHVYDLGQDFWEAYFASDDMRSRFDVLSSRPSIVEASLKESPFRAALAWMFKAPWYFLGRHWGFVGGWEMVIKRR